MSIVRERLEVVNRICSMLDDFENQEDVDAIVEAVTALVQDCECQDDDDYDPDGTPKDEEEEPLQEAEVRPIKVA